MVQIAHIESPFDDKFGVPRQSGLASGIKGRIVFEPEYRNADAVRGLEGFDYIWLIWEFSLTGARWEPTVRPPRLGGNKRMGVFATRSTFRPNAIGLSSVRLEKVVMDPVKGPVLEISGADLVDGTPVLDIKPYITYADSHPEAASGWVDDVEKRTLEVRWAAECPEELRSDLEEVLSLDPRPSYIDNPERIYGMNFRGMNVRFKVSDAVLTVTELSPRS